MKTALLERLFAFLFAILAMPLFAYSQENEIVIENITYHLFEENGSCEVVKVPATYAEEIKIPQIITWNNKTYTVTRIGREAFKVDKDISNYVKNIYLPLTIEEIGVGAFTYLYNITGIEIPENVKYIDYKGLSDLKNLTNLYCYAATPPALGEDVFKKSNLKNAILFVPESSIELYKKQKQWKDFKNIVAINNRPGYAVEENERLVREKAEKEEQERIRAEQERIRAEQERIRAEQERIKIQEDSVAAENGDVNAIIRLAERYRAGNGLTQDMQKSFTLYQKAANLGDINSMYNLGMAYYYGNGTTKDIDTALDWLNKAAEGGDSNALIKIKDIQRENGLFWDSPDKWQVTFSNIKISPYKSENNEVGIRIDDPRLGGYGYYYIVNLNNLTTKEAFDSFVNKKSKLTPSNASSIDIECYQALENFESSTINTVFSEIFDFISYNSINKVQVYHLQNRMTGATAWSQVKTYSTQGFYYPKTKKYNSLEQEAATKFASRFGGSNPMKLSWREVIRVGRSYSLLLEFINWCSQYFNGYKLQLSIDQGASKCYDIINSNNRRAGFIWVRGGTVSSVSWY